MDEFELFSGLLALSLGVLAVFIYQFYFLSKRKIVIKKIEEAKPMSGLKFFYNE